jgi:hypothetical protein
MTGPITEVIEAYEEYVQGPRPLPAREPSGNGQEALAEEALFETAAAARPPRLGFPQPEPWTAGDDR